ncbi:MAG: hypothetical protein KF841_10015 [Phycisphaerae bacterium]|nr:hypothetical protein [Phycisphaerae bacterium]
MRPYSPWWLLFLLIAGIVDPLYGLACKVSLVFWRAAVPPRCDSLRRRRRGLVLVLGGIEGPSPYNRSMALGILASRFRGAVIRLDWNDGIPFWRSIVNLMWPPHQERQVARIVEFLSSYRRAHPDSPVHIISQSGGTWITLRVLESLPSDVRIRSALLIAPSVSPGYDIRAAANRCEDSLISVGSAGDFFFLGLGTLLFGTSDRKFTPSAGLVGWHHQHPRFIDARWHPEWLRFGYMGNHTTSTSARFIRRVLAPQLLRSAVLARTGLDGAGAALTVSVTQG